MRRLGIALIAAFAIAAASGPIVAAGNPHELEASGQIDASPKPTAVGYAVMLASSPAPGPAGSTDQRRLRTTDNEEPGHEMAA